jgi:hypothetical protein
VPGVVNADDGIAGSSHALHRGADAGARCGGADRGEARPLQPSGVTAPRPRATLEGTADNRLPGVGRI